ncbi:hypothetical protein ACW9HQ_38185 [Nocardia gipuzkoensis]
MTADAQHGRDLRALQAEDRRLKVVRDVLADVVLAASDAMRAKDFVNVAAEQAKQRHASDAFDQVHADWHANWNELIVAEYGPEGAERIRANIRAREAERRAQAPQQSGIERSR